MTNKIYSIQKETFKDVVKKLKKHRKCLLVRPTGFGKTKISTDIAKRYKHAVFLYPNNSTRNEFLNYDLSDIDTHLYTFCKMRNLYKSVDGLRKTFSKLNLKSTIFIIDEAHGIGAPVTRATIEKLMNEICPNATYLGLTATPNRTDKLEIKWHFFDGIMAYEYGLSKAIEEDVFVKPYYVYTPLNKDDINKYYIHRIDNLQISDAKKTQLKSRILKAVTPEKLTIANMDEILRNNLYKYKNNMNYYRFILFFTTFESIHSKKKEIIESFQKVFPDCKINAIVVTSESYETRKNLDVVKKLKAKKNTIDLLFNINMLAQSYHGDITGIMMFRRTISDIIYTQQVGRGLSVAHRNATIIFDFVENLYIVKPDSVILHNKTNTNKINRLGIYFSEDEINLDEETQELLNIERLINNAITEEFEAEVINAYKLGWVDIVYCVNKLHLHDVNDFYKILERYK